MSTHHPSAEHISLDALKKWIFDGDRTALAFSDLKKLRISALAAGICGQALPENVAATAKQRFLTQQARDLAQQQTMQQIAQLFAANQIHFCPIKGADLAPRVYPHGALRPRGDLDILIQLDDRKRALALLQQAGWEQPYSYDNLNHEADMFRNGICLELHFKLPNFPQKKMEKVWQNTIETSPFWHHLSLEYNLLMLFQHSASHKWSNAFLLLDLGFLLKKEGVPDWKKIHATAQEMHLLDPALLFRALADFFPAEVMPKETFPPEICAAFRHKLLCPAAPPKSAQERVMSNAKCFSWSWWKIRFRGLRFSSIRIQTGNPHGHYLKLYRDYLIINGGKLFAFFGGLIKFHHRKNSNREKIEKTIEKFLISPQNGAN